MSFLMTKQTYTAEKSMLQKRAEKQQSFSPSSVLDRGSLRCVLQRVKVPCP